MYSKVRYGYWPPLLEHAPAQHAFLPLTSVCTGYMDQTNALTMRRMGLKRRMFRVNVTSQSHVGHVDLKTGHFFEKFQAF